MTLHVSFRHCSGRTPLKLLNSIFKSLLFHKKRNRNNQNWNSYRVILMLTILKLSCEKLTFSEEKYLKRNVWRLDNLFYHLLQISFHANPLSYKFQVYSTKKTLNRENTILNVFNLNTALRMPQMPFDSFKKLWLDLCHFQLGIVKHHQLKPDLRVYRSLNYKLRALIWLENVHPMAPNSKRFLSTVFLMIILAHLSKGLNSSFVNLMNWM